MDPIPDVLHNEYSELLINDTADLARALTVPWKDRQVQIPPPEGLGVGGEWVECAGGIIWVVSNPPQVTDGPFPWAAYFFHPEYMATLMAKKQTPDS